MLVDARARFAQRTVGWIKEADLSQQELQARLRQMGKEFNTEVVKAIKESKKEGK